MSTSQLNDSLFNVSDHKVCVSVLTEDTDVGLSIVSVFLLGNFVVGLPANSWVVWLICRGSRELLASDIYFLSLAVCEIFYCLGLPAQLYCMYTFEHAGYGLDVLLMFQWSLMWVGRPIFQGCVCIERYIAVVHPLLFIRLKPLKYRVAQCALAWFAYFLTISLMWAFKTNESGALLWFIPTLCLLLYCTFSVLCSLKRPGPGEREGEERKAGDRMKRRAFNIILVHLACFVVNYVPLVMIEFLPRKIHVSGVFVDLVLNLGMVCGLVQPFLYLHRAGKLCCVKTAQS